VKEFLSGSVLGLEPAVRPCEAALLVSFGARCGPDYQAIFFDKKGELLQVDTPLLHLIPLSPGRYQCRVLHLDETAADSPHNLTVSFCLRTANSVEEWEKELSSREQVTLNTQVTDTDGRATLTIQVRLRDMYQLACGIRVICSSEARDFSPSVCARCAAAAGGEGEEERGGGPGEGD